jgi:hypothetical protein
VFDEHFEQPVNASAEAIANTTKETRNMPFSLKKNKQKQNLVLSTGLIRKLLRWLNKN